MKIIRSAIIKAVPEKVFEAITDFPAYSRWNPWIIMAEGECREGADVLVQARVGNKARPYHHRILKIDKPHVFHWCDRGWFTVLADGNRKRMLAPHPDGTRYQVELEVTGCMAFLVDWLFGKSLEEGMTAETEALKSYVEAAK